MRNHLARVLSALVLFAATLGLGTQVASAQLPAETARVEISGHGWGHGRGLGQYGAYGYAENYGWNSAQILDHFYGGTTAGPAPANGTVDPTAVRVEMRYMRGFSTTVALAEGNILIRGLNDEDLGLISNGAVRLTYTAGQFWIYYSDNCDGSFTNLGAISGHTTIRLLADSDGVDENGLLSVCRSGVSKNWYDGEIQASVHKAVQRTVNAVSVEQYLRGVVPKESPASWPAAALEAQSVAARSYVLAGDTRQLPYADTCETTLCQVYGGRYAQNTSGQFFVQTDPRTDSAIAATAGTVRMATSGNVARTEFSSSTGGYTTGGSFAAVIDKGDAIAANPNQDWTVSVDVLALERKFKKGRLHDIVVTGRNGLGADGGRVTSIEFQFENGTVTQTGWKARTTLGLKSDWFVVGQIDRFHPDEVSNFVDSAYVAFTGNPPTASERTQWTTYLASNSRLELTTDLAYSEAYAGQMIDHLYERALGRKSDAAGKAYWMGLIADGTRIDYMGVLFYGSAEYYNNAGSSSGYVTKLYAELLGRQPEAKGLDYWTDLLDRGIARPDDVAAGFYIAEESRNLRAALILENILGSEPDAPTIAYWSERLLAVDDLVISAEIAASDVYYIKVNQR